MNASKSLFPLLAGVMLMGASLAYAAPVPDQTAIDKCRGMTDRIARLSCFDTAFNTPAQIMTPDAPVVPAVITPVQSLPGPLQNMAEEQERSRAPGQVSWLARIRPWQSSGYSTDPALFAAATSNDNFDMVLTTPELDLQAKPEAPRGGDRAVLMVSCENNITSLMVVLPKPIDGLQANMSLSSDNNAFSRLSWRDVEDGKVISAGRGLESIDTLQTLLHRERIQVQVNYPDGARAFVFAVADLAEKLKPLRFACHW